MFNGIKFNHFQLENIVYLFKKRVSDESTLRWAKLSEHAFEPTKGSEQAAGLDLRR